MSSKSTVEPYGQDVTGAALEAAQAFWRDQWRASDPSSRVSIPWTQVPALDLPDGFIDGILEAKAALVEAVQKLRAAVPDDAYSLNEAGWPAASDIALSVHLAAEGIEESLDNLSVTPDIRSLYEDAANGTRDGFDGVRFLLDVAAAVDRRVESRRAEVGS